MYRLTSGAQGRGHCSLQGREGGVTAAYKGGREGSLQPTRKGGREGSLQPTREGGREGSLQPTREGGREGSLQPTREGGREGSLQPTREGGREGSLQPTREGGRGSQIQAHALNHRSSLFLTHSHTQRDHKHFTTPTSKHSLSPGHSLSHLGGQRVFDASPPIPGRETLSPCLAAQEQKKNERFLPAKMPRIQPSQIAPLSTLQCCPHAGFAPLSRW